MNNTNRYSYIYDKLNDLYDEYKSLIDLLNEANTCFKDSIVCSNSIDNSIINVCKQTVKEDIYNIETIINNYKSQMEKGDLNG